MTIQTVLMYGATLAWAVFIAWYALRARWWESPAGRNIMGVAVAIFTLLVLISAQTTWPGYWLRPYAQIVVFGALIALAVQRTAQMERAQRGTDRRKS